MFLLHTPLQPAWLGKLTTIKDFHPDPLCSGEQYRLHRANIAGRLHLDSINTRPGSWAEMLVTLPDLTTALGGGQGLEEVRRLLGGLAISLYSPNPGQTVVLEREGKAGQICPVPLVRVGDLVKQLGGLLEGGRRGAGV